MMWPEGDKFERYDWHDMSLFVPPEMWYHQHFNKGAHSARYLALKPFTSRKFPGLKKQFGTSEDVKQGGSQLEYEDERSRKSVGFLRQSWQRSAPQVTWMRCSRGSKRSPLKQSCLGIVFLEIDHDLPIVIGKYLVSRFGTG